MEAFKSSLILLALFVGLIHAATFPTINIKNPPDVLTAPSWEDSMNPKPYVSSRDSICISSSQISGGVSSLPMFPTAEKFLSVRGMTPFTILMFCDASSQNYYLFLYITSSGLVRLNVFSQRGYSKVTSASILETDFYINRQLEKHY